MAYRVEKDWITEAGLRAVVIMAQNGSGESLTDRHRCGYVGVGLGHPAFVADYNNTVLDDVRVHGGITYDADGHGLYPVETATPTWWLGFDCAHQGDVSYSGIPEIDDTPDYDWDGSPAVFRSLEYCVSECEYLARQLSELKEKKSDTE